MTKLAERLESVKKEITSVLDSVQRDYPGLRITSISVGTEHVEGDDPHTYRTTSLSLTHGGLSADAEEGGKQPQRSSDRPASEHANEAARNK